ncbi:MAG: CDP-glycerol glycerophosphotransferase family protein [Oscillospiraceae bacterium]|nr:CDP-glycerol glycerophosphotransferase family protein [Oscillospiraceae bacterium]
MGRLKQLGVKAGWILGRLLPVDPKKIVFSSYCGKGFGDNLRPIAEELLRRDRSLKMVWLTVDRTAADSLPEGIRACPYGSFRRGLELGTAKVWADTCRKESAPFKKTKQCYLQTWHGFALKQIERDAEKVLPEWYKNSAKRDARQTDLMVSDSRFMTEIYRRAFWYDGPVAEYGAPRNDGLIRGDRAAVKKVRQSLQLPADRKLLLYAPTFRADGSLEPYSVDFPRLKQACQQRFGGEFAMLVRLHPNVSALAEQFVAENGQVVNVTTYPDNQELLAAADVLVTDYSSIMFDFMLTGRPCFQFASDIEAYRNDRNFYFSLDRLPFPLAEDNAALERAVLGFREEDYRTAVDRFIREMGIITDGRGAERCADWILQQMEQK